MSMTSIETIQDVVNVYRNYPHVIDDEPALIRHVLELDDTLIELLRANRHPCADRAIPGLFIVSLIRLPRKFDFPNNSLVLVDGDKARKFCSMVNKYNGYSKMEVDIIVHMATGNCVIQKASGKFVLLPGPSLTNN